MYWLTLRVFCQYRFVAVLLRIVDQYLRFYFSYLYNLTIESFINFSRLFSSVSSA